MIYLIPTHQNNIKIIDQSTNQINQLIAIWINTYRKRGAFCCRIGMRMVRAGSRQVVNSCTADDCKRSSFPYRKMVKSIFSLQWEQPCMANRLWRRGWMDWRGSASSKVITHSTGWRAEEGENVMGRRKCKRHGGKQDRMAGSGTGVEVRFS